MKYKIILIILAVLITFGITLGIGYTLSNKSSKEDMSNVNTKNEEIINEQVVEENEKNADLPIEVDEKSIEKVKEDVSSNTTNEIENNSNVETKIETTEPSNPVATPKTVVSTENKTEENVTLYKYGVNLIETNTYKVITYSDGTQDKSLISTKKKYDKSGYNGTTDTLKSEAQIVANSNKTIYKELLGYVNNYRREVGVANIILDDKLSLAATIRAMEMAYSGKFNHYRPNGKLCFSILGEMGISYYTTGENIAAGQSNAEGAARSWRDSKDGHYESMINSDYNKIGIGMYSFDGTKYWVQLFTN